jgi:OOP family OmpA-OmpF porin
MKTNLKLSFAIALAFSASSAFAADDTFVNPDWANSAVYIGGSVGQGRSHLDDVNVVNTLTGNAPLARYSDDQRDRGFKLFVGKQLNQYFAIEGGYFDLGSYRFDALTTANRAVTGDTKLRGLNVDVVGQLPLSERFSILGRVGAQYTRTKTDYNGAAITVPGNRYSSDTSFGPKVGLGLEYKFSEALAARVEMERNRINSGVGQRGNVDLISIGLVYKLGRPAAAPYGSTSSSAGASTTANVGKSIVLVEHAVRLRQSRCQARRQSRTGRHAVEAARHEHRSHDRRRPHRLGRLERVQPEAVAASC